MELITRLSCGCEIWRNELVNCGYELKRCPLHKAAPDLYQALKNLIDVTAYNSPEYQKARRVVAKAEGKDVM